MPLLISSELPPQNLEAEQSVLGSILIDREAGLKVFDTLAPEVFYREAHQRIYQVMGEQADDGKPVDLVTLAEALRRKGLLESVGGEVYLTVLMDAVPTAANIEYYANILIENYEMRCCVTAINSCSELLGRGGTNWKDSVEALREIILNVALDRKVTNNTDFKTRVLELGVEAINRESRLEFKGLDTGFPLLDRKTTGMKPGELWLLGARPAMGKTAMGLSMIRHIAGVRKAPTLWLSLEGTLDALTYRLLAMEAGVFSHTLTMGVLSEQEKARVDAACQRMKQWPLLIERCPGLSAGQLRRKARLAKSGEGLELLVVDHLSLMKAGGNGKRYDKTSDLADDVMNVVGDLDVALLGLVQLSRAAEGRDDKRPQLGDFRDTGAWEQNAHGAMGLYREGYYDKNLAPDETQDGELILLKNRDGETGTVPVEFIPGRTFFRERREEDPYAGY